MSANPVIVNPNDFKVVSFTNSTTFGFTPDMGCMFDGRPINGIHGSPGIDAGEKITLPFHIGHRLAVNLAKRVLNTSPAATVDAQGIPTGVAVWSAEKLEELKNTFLTDLYAETKPVAESETDKLMAKVEEYKKMVDVLVAKVETPKEEVKTETQSAPQVFSDKQEVLAELEKRNIKHDKRQSKDALEKLLT